MFLRALIVFVIWCVIAVYWHLCINKQVCFNSDSESENVATEIVKEKPKLDYQNNLVIKDNSISVFKFENNFELANSKTDIGIPEELAGWKDSIFQYLNKNPSKLIRLVIKESENEGNSDAIAKGRGEFLEQELINFGINKGRVVLDFEKASYKFNSEGMFKGGIELFFDNPSEEEQKNISSNIEKKTLYSHFGSDEFIPDNTLIAYVNDLKEYLKSYPTKKVSIIGHTDFVGEEEVNYYVGLQRSNTVKKYFENNGILESSMSTDSKGETEPIGDNRTKEGRRENRRIEITVN